MVVTEAHALVPRNLFDSAVTCSLCGSRLAATSKDEAMAVMEEEDMDAVAEAWGADEELIPGAPTEGLDEEMEGFEDGAPAQEGEDEEGGWDMEVCHYHP